MSREEPSPPRAPLIGTAELKLWSFYRALIAEFIATFLFLYVTVATIIGHMKEKLTDQCDGVGFLGISWAFGGMIYNRRFMQIYASLLVYFQVLAPLPIGFAVFAVHLATIPITGTGINQARSFGAAIISFGNVGDKTLDDQWIFSTGPFIGAVLATAYHECILREAAIKAQGSFRSVPRFEGEQTSAIPLGYRTLMMRM